MIEPHGGRLVDREASGEHADQLRDDVSSAPVVQLTDAQFQDVINITTGRFSPLTGFMSRNDFLKVVHDMSLEDGTTWSLPVTLDVESDLAAELVPGEKIGLESPRGNLVAALQVDEVYKYNKEESARHIYGTSDLSHPGVKKHFDAGDFLVGGDIFSFDEHRYNEFDLFPAETRVLFERNGWDTVVGFQTRNAPHRAHEYIQKSALEHTDGLLVQPKLGYKKPGDYRDNVIIGTYQKLIENYYNPGMVALSVFPSQMRYAGPREAIFDAIVRKNQGCTHFVVGRDHAGVEDYYDGFDAHRVFDEVSDLGIEPMFYSYSFYCESCDGMTSEKLCPHDESVQVHPSGTQIRNTVKEDEHPSDKMMRSEVASYLMDESSPFVQSDDEQVIEQ